jgi:hypothetical protein
VDWNEGKMNIYKPTLSAWNSYIDSILRARLPVAYRISLSVSEQTVLTKKLLRGIAIEERQNKVRVSFEDGEYVICDVLEICGQQDECALFYVEVVDSRRVHHLIEFVDPLPIPKSSASFDAVDEVGEGSFPASDPPPWSASHIIGQ